MCSSHSDCPGEYRYCSAHYRHGEERSEECKDCSDQNAGVCDAIDGDCDTPCTATTTSDDEGFSYWILIGVVVAVFALLAALIVRKRVFQKALDQADPSTLSDTQAATGDPSTQNDNPVVKAVVVDEKRPSSNSATDKNPVVKAVVVDENRPSSNSATDKKLMMSGRFDGGHKEQFLRATATALQNLGMTVLVVEASPGSEGFGQQTMDNLLAMDVMVAFAFEDCELLSPSRLFDASLYLGLLVCPLVHTLVPILAMIASCV
eukprot:COSAG06_NODE_1083_length_10780_cov_2.547608_9_plen_262_part_00